MRTGAVLLISSLLGAASVGGAAPHPEAFAGTYSNLWIDEETQELLGYKLRIAIVSQRSVSVTLWCAQGELSSPIEAKAQLSGNLFTFTHKNSECGKQFTAHVLPAGIKLTVDGDQNEPILKRQVVRKGD